MKLVALFGKSGSGKSTILKNLINLYPNDFNEIITCTTRPPREGEQDGVDYHFLTIEQFTKKVLNGDMLEATEFNGWHYGTASSCLLKEKINIGVFSPTSIYCLMENSEIDLFIYYIKASDKTRLIRQLNREENPEIEEIIRRYKADNQDFSDISDIPYKEFINEYQSNKKFIANKIWSDAKKTRKWK